MDVEQKKVLIEDLFSTIEASGSENLSEIQAGGLKSFTAMLKRIESFAPESREMVQELFLALFGGWLEQLKLPDMEKSHFYRRAFPIKSLKNSKFLVLYNRKKHLHTFCKMQRNYIQ